MGATLVKYIDGYLLSIIWVGVHKPVSLIFFEPPTHETIYEFLAERWRKLPIEEQNKVWETILIAYLVPTIPWTGKLENQYGAMICERRSIIDNRAERLDNRRQDGSHKP